MGFEALSGLWYQFVGFLPYLPPIAFVLGVVIFVHELGHFLVARYYGVAVKAFSIGFGPEITGFYDSHGTRWRISWIPLGGYVMFEGDENVASMPAGDLDAIPESKRAGILHLKPLYQRAAVSAAGPVANFILAIVILFFWYMVIGKAIIEPRVASVAPDSAAAAAGFKPDDLIVKIDGSEIESFDDVQRIVMLSANTPLKIAVVRDGREIVLDATPRLTERKDGSSSMKIGLLGIRSSVPRVARIEAGSAAAEAGFKVGDLIVQVDKADIQSFADVRRAAVKNPGKTIEITVERDGRPVTLRATPHVRERKTRSGKVVKTGVLGVHMEEKELAFHRQYPPRALTLALSETWFNMKVPFIFIQKLFLHEASGQDVGGIIRIGELAHDVAAVSPIALFHLLAVISVQIGLLNLFPIPILDGGHLLFYGIEAIRGRPLSERAIEVSFRIGFVLVIMLMLFATRNDVIHLLR